MDKWRVKVTEEEIGGWVCEIEVSTIGSFYVIRKKDQVELGYGSTKEEAVRKARTNAAKLKMKLSVPAFTFIGGRFQNLVITGKHAKTEKALVRINGEAEQLGMYDQVFKAEMPEDVRAEYIAADEQHHAALKKKREIEKQWHISIEKLYKPAEELELAKQAENLKTEEQERVATEGS